LAAIRYGSGSALGRTKKAWDAIEIFQQKMLATVAFARTPEVKNKLAIAIAYSRCSIVERNQRRMNSSVLPSSYLSRYRCEGDDSQIHRDENDGVHAFSCGSQRRSRSIAK